MVDLNRFIKAHKEDFNIALNEIENAKKLSHWMWYIFPQIKGLGESYMSNYFAITSLVEAEAFLNNEYLGNNIRKICKVLLHLKNNNAEEVFGCIDSLKLKSSMTLFNIIAPNDVFGLILDKFFNGEKCYKTLDILDTKNIF